MQESFYWACAEGYTKAVQEYIKNPRVDPSFDHGRGLRLAANHGHANVVRVLLADPRVDPLAKDNESLFRAFAHGRTEVARVLLADPRIDASANNNSAIEWAVKHANVDLVRDLLADPRVNALGAVPWADRVCARVMAADERWGFEVHRDLYSKFHPQLVQEYDATLSRCFAMAFVAKQLTTWSDMVEPVAKRLKKGTFL